MITLLLNKNDIPALTALSGNIDADSLNPFIGTAQTNDIKRILGADLYEKILEHYKTDSLLDEYKTIYDDYVVNMLVYFAVCFYLSFGGYKISNNGIYKAAIDGGQAVDIKEVNGLVSRYRELATTLELQFYDYMKTIDIPEYNRTQEDENNNNPIIPWY
jgi:hypothetical protein